MTAISAEWWLCWKCWIAYHVPTTFFYGACPQCGEATRPWPADPNRLRMMELKLTPVQRTHEED
jgi:hypothetical protein